MALPKNIKGIEDGASFYLYWKEVSENKT